MRALENRSIFSGVRHDREKQINEHRERLKTIKNVVDTSKPSTMETRCTSPSKKIITKQVARERIVKDNLLLARKIFNIMEGNSDITDKINDSRHIDNHPGTMNFRQRLSEAQRIHERNMLLASRLDTVQPYYKIADLTIVKPVKKKTVHKSHNSKKSKFARELGLVLKADRAGNAGDLTHRSAGSADYFGAYKFSPVGDGPAHSQSARKPEYHAEGFEPESRSENQRTRPSNVLLEYTKIQDGRVLDVAVLKEPFRDRYAIFGIDVDDGQRYELRLTSDEVSSILDGDMLVTSVDNVEVWMALLNKVILQKVGYFARLPFSAEEVDQINTKESGNNSPGGGKLRKPLDTKTDETDNEEYGEEIAIHYTLDHRAVQVVSTPPMFPATAAAVNAAAGKTLVPVAPAASRPSDRPSSRAISGGAVTSAAGAVRGRHLKSSGQGNQSEGSAGLLGGDQPIDDTILSLFADAGLGVEVDRMDVVTPGFMDNATSATVTLVQANADFPDAPEGTKQTDSDSAENEPSVEVEKEPEAESSKKSVPSKPRSLKSGGSTRAASLRAAAVRRRSIESEQASAAVKPTQVAPAVVVKPSAPAKVTPVAPAAAKDKESAPPSQKSEKSEPPPRKSSVIISKSGGSTKAAANASDAKSATVDTKTVPAVVSKGEAKPAPTQPPAVAPATTNKPIVAAATPTDPVGSDSGRPKSSRGLGSAGGAAVTTEAPATQGAADSRPKAGALVPKAPANASVASGARPVSKGVTRPVSQGKATSPKAVSKAVPSVVQQKTIEETRVLVQNYVTNALDLAVAGALKNLHLQEQSRTQTAAGEGGDLVGDELSTVLKEGSRITNKSQNASEVEASLDYSMDFERSL